jgi:hypothetical protein
MEPETPVGSERQERLRRSTTGRREGAGTEPNLGQEANKGDVPSGTLPKTSKRGSEEDLPNFLLSCVPAIGPAGSPTGCSVLPSTPMDGALLWNWHS